MSVARAGACCSASVIARRMCVCAIVLGAAVVVLGDDRPVALLNIERHRNQLVNGSVQWKYLYNEAPGGNVFSAGRDQMFESRFAGDDVIWVSHGDREGVVLRTPGGGAATETVVDKGSMLILGKDRTSIRRDEWGLRAEKWFLPDHHPGLRDPRALGLHNLKQEGGVSYALWGMQSSQAAVPAQYEVERDGDLHIVTVIKRDGKYKKKYWIDSARDWNPVRVAYYYDGELKREIRSELKKWEGHWFPEKIAEYDVAYEDGKKPATVAIITSAEFNHPDHPQEFTPADIGVDVGMNITVRDMRPGGDRTGGLSGIWDGEKVISNEEWKERSEKGELALGEQMRKILAYRRSNAKRNQGAQQLLEAVLRDVGSWTSRDWESVWEQYVRLFILRHNLNDDQRAKAERVLADCQQKAHKYLTRRKDELTEAEDKLHDVFELDPSPEREKTAATLREKFRKLIAPLDTIFREELKPRLERIPTRKQKAEAKGK